MIQAGIQSGMLPESACQFRHAKEEITAFFQNQLLITVSDHQFQAKV